jgi:hypothetical protein
MRPGTGPNSIRSHSHSIPVSLFRFGQPTYLPLARFLDYRHLFPIFIPSRQDSYITSDPFALCPDNGGSTLLCNFGRIQLQTPQYIPEDSDFHTRRRENFKSKILNCNLVLRAV